MEKRKGNNWRRGVTGYTKEGERTFFFYATIAMFIFWAFLVLWAD